MDITKKLVALFVVLICTISMQNFSKSRVQFHNDYSVLKRAYQNKKKQILYELKPMKETIEPIEFPLVLRDKFSPKTRLDSVLDLPDYYTKGRKRFAGFPAKDEYKEVTSLEWTYTPSVRNVWSQISMMNGYNVGNCIRTDLLEAFESTPSFQYLSNVEEHNPIIQQINGDRFVLFPTLHKKVVCLNAVTGEKKWEYSLSSNDKIIPGMSSFEYNQNVYLVAATHQKKILVIDIENGKLVSTLYLSSVVTSPIASFAYQEKPCIAYFTTSQIIIQEVFSKKVLLEEESHSESYLSPLCIKANQTQVVVFPSQNGSIKGYSLQQKMWWRIQLSGRIPYQISFNAWDGVPYIVTATTEKKMVLIHGRTGSIVATEELPGIPVSPSMLIPKFNQYFVSVFLAETSEMKFVSGFFFSEEKPKQIVIPGTSLLGFSSYIQNGIPRFIFLNNQLELFSLCSDDRSLQGKYPLQLSRSNHFYGETPKCICFSLTQEMLWVVVPGEGVFRFGNPSKAIENETLCTQSKWSTGFINTAKSYHTGNGYFNCVDQIPELTTPTLVKKEIVLSEKNRPLPSPVSFWDAYQRKWFFMYINNEGFLQLRDEELNPLYAIQYRVGKSQVPPLVEIDKKGNWHIYTVTSEKTTALLFHPITKRVEVVWEATDMKSTGSSFQSFRYNQIKLLLFVSDTGYLISLEEETGELAYKEKVDAYTFVTSFAKGNPVIFCGSSVLNAINGEVVERFGCTGSDSTIATLDGRIVWLQSFEDDMICIDAQSGTILWKVRKLWCKKYCYRATSPAVYKKGNIAFSYWSDYKRVVCVDMRSGLIRWRIQLPDDYVVEQPIVVDTNEGAFVFFTTVNGVVHKLNAWSGEHLDRAFCSEKETSGAYTGLSTPVFLNNCLLFSRAGYGYYRIGFPKATSIGIPQKQFQVYIPSLQKGKYIFNRAELYWNEYAIYSNIIKTLMQQN